MAERGAHLTGTAFAKPSIFEIAAHKSLAATLEPAAKKIITVNKKLINTYKIVPIINVVWFYSFWLQ